MGEKKIYGYPIRDPYPKEMHYFKLNPTVSGMAAEDNSIVLNPYSKLSATEMQSVAKNEAVRLFLRQRNIVPTFEVSNEQVEYFKGTPYEKDEISMKQTIVGRILSGDPSIKPTEEQSEYAKSIQSVLDMME